MELHSRAFLPMHLFLYLMTRAVPRIMYNPKITSADKHTKKKKMGSYCTLPEKPFLSLQLFCLIGYVPSVVLFTYVVSFTFKKVQNTKEFWSFIFSVVSNFPSALVNWEAWFSPKPRQPFQPGHFTVSLLHKKSNIYQCFFITDIY